MPSTTRVPAAIDALVTALEAVLDPGIVYDGPELTGDAPPVVVCVGYDGDPEGDMRAVENWAQTWLPALGQQRREESFDVLGCVIAFSGDTSVKDRRDAVFATFGTFETAIRAAANVALGLGAPAQAEFSAGEFYQEQTGSGLQGRIPWRVSVSRVRI